MTAIGVVETRMAVACLFIFAMSKIRTGRWPWLVDVPP